MKTQNVFTLIILLSFIAVTAISIIKKIRKKMIQKMKLIPPVPLSYRVTSGFGQRKSPTSGASTNHNGIDLNTPIRTTVVAPDDGVVTMQNTHTTGGKQLSITAKNGYRYGFAHLSDNSVVNLNESVKQGQVIAYTGNTGNTTGAHLHLTVTDNLGKKIDPTDIFPYE